MSGASARVLQTGIALISMMTVLLGTTPSHAQGGGMFAGKTIRLLISTAPGGGYDFRARTMAKYVGRHLPGEPTLIAENMPGGGSVIAMNYTYSIAPKDGTVLCLFQRSIFSMLFEKPDAVKFDLAKYEWIGNMGADNGVIVVWHTAPHKTADDLFKTEAIVAMPAGIKTQPAAINGVLGTKMKIISGYPGTTEMQAAMERGEVMGLGEISWSNLKLTHQDWLRDGRVRVLLQIGLKRAPDLLNVPLPQDLAKTDEDKRILDIVATQRQFAYPIVLPPGVPADRVAAWQKAFLALGQDKDFMAEMDKFGFEFDPTPGDEMARNMGEMTNSITPALVERIKGMVGPPQ
jgi:tripartite-type tricarboxylate transporter receptor subunit TctC